jgi:tetratricopeptide (TPR) repeat protein
MKNVRLLITVALLSLSGCAGFETQGEFTRGRQALIRGDASGALAYFQRVAEADANFRSNTIPLRESIWTYIGRAEYQSGNYAEARQALEKALVQYNGDQMARLYLGLTLARMPAAPAKTAGFSVQDISFALREGIDPERVVALARERGVAFDFSKEAESQLKKAGADARLLEEIKKIRAQTAGKSETQTGRAHKELSAALTGLRSDLNSFTANSTQGKFWDPGGELMRAIEAELALLKARDPDWNKIIPNGESLGQKLEEEVDRARREEAESFRHLPGR